MRFILLLVLFCGVVSTMQAQVRPGGLLVSDEKYRQAPLLPAYSGSKYNEIALRVNLKKYCPVAGDQQQIGACVGWAVGYGALTIMRAQQAGIDDRSVITQMAHSAAFIYNQIKIKPEDCSAGAYIEDALSLLKDSGDCLEKSFNYQKQDCRTMPFGTAMEEAKTYRIQDYAAVFGVDEPGKSKISKICKVLATQTPIVVGMGVTADFWEIKPGTQLWDPAEGAETNSFHAMVLVGYDNVEKQVELLNSFGASWGHNGFIRIKYDDFQRLCRYAYVLMPQQSVAVNLAENGVLPARSAESAPLSGEFVFRKPAGYLKTEDGDDIPFFEEVATRRLSEQGIYVSETPYFEVGDAFQLLAREIPRGRYAYVFSQSPGGRVKLHFPRIVAAGKTANFVLEKTVEIVIPGEETLLQLPSPGYDYLCIVYSSAVIEDMDRRLAALQNDAAPFAQRVNAVFGDLLIPSERVQFNPNKMAFSALPNPQLNQIAVPLILQVEAK
jgi:Papain family cysteine protease